jgi:hypothetical protein
MQPAIDATVGARLSRLNNQECRELSRLCGLILEPDSAE